MLGVTYDDDPVGWLNEQSGEAGSVIPQAPQPGQTGVQLSFPQTGSNTQNTPFAVNAQGRPVPIRYTGAQAPGNAPTARAASSGGLFSADQLPTTILLGGLAVALLVMLRR